MMPVGLSSATLRAFQATLIQHHEIDVKVTIQDLNGNSLADVSDRLTDGQVNVDATAPVTRSATVTLLDKDRALPFDSAAPADAALYLDRMLHITYGVLVGGVWVRVPVFTGPVTKLDRSDATVNVEAQGKEALAMAAAWAPMTLPKGTRKTTAIQYLMINRAGENQFSIPALTATLTGPLSIPRTGQPWFYAQRIAKSMNRQLFYGGDGICRLRTIPATTLYTFTDQAITSRPQISYSTDDLANTVMVIGAVPKGAKTAVTYTAMAAASDPLSPYKLGRNGVGRHLLSVVNDDTVGTITEAAALARSTLASSLLQAVDASFEALPVPHLEPGDLCVLSSASASTTFRLQKFSLPLVAGPAMSVGFLRNLAVRPRRVNR
jgi:hypothetical protein